MTGFPMASWFSYGRFSVGMGVGREFYIPVKIIITHNQNTYSNGHKNCLNYDSVSRCDLSQTKTL